MNKRISISWLAVLASVSLPVAGGADTSRMDAFDSKVAGYAISVSRHLPVVGEAFELKRRSYRALFQSAMEAREAREIHALLDVIERDMNANRTSLKLIGRKNEALVRGAILDTRKDLQKSDLQGAKARIARAGEAARQMGIDL